jgi:hypothetical protein
VDISLGEPRIFSLEPRIPLEDAAKRAEDKKTGALGTGIGGILQRPKSEDVQLLKTQRRVEPFWHVACTAHYVYDRTRPYTVPTSASDVRSVTFLGSDFEAHPSGKGPATFAFEVLEHCAEDIRDELYVDGVTGSTLNNGAGLTSGTRTEVADPTTLGADETLVVAPEQRASAIVRQLLAKVMRPLQADTVLEESLAVERLDLYYRPVWAFEYHVPAKGKKGVVEVDALTGDTRTATDLKMSALTRKVSKDALFDIGADTVGLIVPGGSIALKLARLAVDRDY